MIILIAVIIFFISIISPKQFIYVLILISIALPASYDTTQFFSFNIGNWHFLYTDYFFLLLIIRWGLSKTESRNKTEIDSFLYYLYAFILAGGISIIIGFLNNYKLAYILFDSRALLYYLTIPIMASFVTEERIFHKILVCFVTGMIAYCLLTISFLLLGTSHPFYILFESLNAQFLGRIAFHNDNYFFFIFPLVVFYLLHLKGKNAIRIGLLFAVVLFLTKIVITMGRGFIGLLILSLLIYPTKKYRGVIIGANTTKRSMRKVFLLILIPFIILTIVQFGLPLLFHENTNLFVSTFLTRITDYDSSSWQEAHMLPRELMYKKAIDEIISSPLTGHGYGYTFEISLWSQRLSFVDSTFLTVWIRMGVVGLFLLLLFIYKFIYLLKYILNNKSMSNKFILEYHYTLVAGGFAFLIMMIINSFLINSPAIFPLMVLIGATLGYWKNVLSTNNKEIVSEKMQGIIE